MKFQDFVQQAKNAQEKIQEHYRDFLKIQEGLVKNEYTGYAQSKRVKIVLDGYGHMKSIYIDPQLLAENPEIIESLIVQAHNDAKTKIKELIDHLTKIMESMFTYRGLDK